MTDWPLILTVIGVGISVIGFIYGFLRNFKQDVHKDIEEMKKRMDLQEERMFLLATGKSLAQAMTEAKINLESRK